MIARALRILRPDDARALAMIHANLFDTPWSPADFRSELAKPTTLSLGICAENNEVEIVSFVLFQHTLDNADMLTIATARPHQREGLARDLLKTAFDHLSQRGVSRVLLDVADDNIAAITFYTALGFARDGVRKAYYRSHDGPAKDAILMSRVMTRLR